MSVATNEQIRMAVVNKLRTIASLRVTPDQPQMNVSAYPYLMVWVSEAHYTQQSATLRTNLGVITVQIHVPYRDLARDLPLLAEYSDGVPTLLLNDTTLSGVVSHVGPIDGRVRADTVVGEQQTLCWEFRVGYKVVNQGIT